MLHERDEYAFYWGHDFQTHKWGWLAAQEMTHLYTPRRHKLEALDLTAYDLDDEFPERFVIVERDDGNLFAFQSIDLDTFTGPSDESGEPE